MPKGIPNITQVLDPNGNPPSNAVPAEKMVPMKLERNYRPAGEHDIVGHTRPEIRRKDPSGKETIVQAEEWIAGEAMPAPVPGAGFATKIWAGTVLKLPEAEAKAVRKAGIGSLEFADA